MLKTLIGAFGFINLLVFAIFFFEIDCLIFLYIGFLKCYFNFGEKKSNVHLFAYVCVSEMGIKAKKAMKKKLKKGSSQLSAASGKDESADFLVCSLSIDNC